jgi:hypothetical protein
MTVFHTVVTELPPTPLGVLPARWRIEHWCTTCRHRVASDELLAHAQDHHHSGVHHEGGAID